MENKLQVIIEAVDKASSVLKKISNTANKSFTSIEKAGSKLKDSFWAIAVGVSGVWIAAAKMAMDFDKSMSNVSTLIDTSKESMQKMKKEVLDLASKTPVALSDLTSALYDVRSAWVDAKNAMAVLTSSAKLAVAGLGSTKDAVNLMTSAFNAFAKQGYSADQIANILFKTVKNGKTTVAQLSQGFGALAGLASTVWIKFDELMASTAALTTTGLSASEAYTGLKAIITSVVNPTTQAAKVAKQLWIDFSAAALKSKWLSKFLQEVKEKTHWNTEVMSQLFGSVEALNAVLSLTWSNADAFSKTLQDMKTKANWLDEAYKKQKQTFWATYNILKNKLQVAMVQLGEKITPILQKIINWIDKNPKLTQTILAITWVVVWLAAVLWTLGIVISWVTTAIWAMGTALTVLTWPVWVVIGIIWGLIYIWWQVAKHWKELSELASLRWENIKLTISNKINEIKLILSAVWSIIVNSIKAKYYEMYTDALVVFQKVKNAIVSSFESIKWPVLAVVNWVKWKIDWILNKINRVKNKVSSAVSRASRMAHKATRWIGSRISSWISAVKNFAWFRADGWPVESWKAYIVWERGPELFIPKQSGTIIPNWAASWVNITINFWWVVVKNEADENRLVEKIKYALSREMQYANLWIN